MKPKTNDPLSLIRLCEHFTFRLPRQRPREGGCGLAPARSAFAPLGPRTIGIAIAHLEVIDFRKLSLPCCVVIHSLYTW
ncbi:hypothetical protein PUN28_011795 [Cardiocondyla obscurior]|uniref:Uncharacterized protein n=1 Tax=Cardiocondyla obscurior TaxID=286306 RepID=A0AAW2FLD6_9HYME